MDSRQLHPLPTSSEETVTIRAISLENHSHLEERPLTTREAEILQLIVQGYSNTEIAKILNVSEGTVKSHIRNILDKLGVRDRTQAAVLALRSGLVN